MPTNWNGRTIAGASSLEVIETGSWDDLVNWDEILKFWWDRGIGGQSNWNGRIVPGTNALEVIFTGSWDDTINWQELPNYFWWDEGGGGAAAWSGRTPV